jgi:hypothetical protein
MLKLIYLGYHHNLSDRQVIARAETDLAFRYFLQIPLHWGLPDPGSLCIFRGRLGSKGFRKVFHQVVQTARQHGVVRDRLRIKDATHVIANIALPTGFGVGRSDPRQAARGGRTLRAVLVEGERIKLQMMREAKAQQPSERLAARLAQLREMLVWADGLTAPEDAETNRAWQRLLPSAIWPTKPSMTKNIPRPATARSAPPTRTHAAANMANGMTVT